MRKRLVTVVGLAALSVLPVVYFLTFPRGAIIDRDAEVALFFALNTVIGIAVSYTVRCTTAASFVLYPAMFCGLAWAITVFIACFLEFPGPSAAVPLSLLAFAQGILYGAGGGIVFVIVRSAVLGLSK